MRESDQEKKLTINKTRSKCIIIGNDDTQNLELGQEHLKGVRTSKYLGVISKEIAKKQKYKEGKQVTRSPNSALWTITLP